MRKKCILQKEEDLEEKEVGEQVMVKKERMKSHEVEGQSSKKKKKWKQKRLKIEEMKRCVEDEKKRDDRSGYDDRRPKQCRHCHKRCSAS